MDKALVYETKDSRFDPGRGLGQRILSRLFNLVLRTFLFGHWRPNMDGGTPFTCTVSTYYIYRVAMSCHNSVWGCRAAGLQNPVKGHISGLCLTYCVKYTTSNIDPASALQVA